jgi:single-stranded-DNA-specific exonuclease
MAKRWRMRPYDAEKIAFLEKSTGLPPVVAQLLSCRGVNRPEEAKTFLEPKLSGLRPPEELPGCRKAAECILQAIRNGEKIVVYGDYDVDGMTGTAILRQTIRHFGGDVSYYVPHRIEEGYGLNEQALKTLAEQETRLLVTVDCGITSHRETRLAQQLGMRVVVTDHHTPTETLPEAEAIAHPQLDDYPFPGLSGSTVAFKVAWALCTLACGEKKVPPAVRGLLIQLVGLAAMGTIADVVPLIDENRVLVRYGLEQSLPNYPTLGLRELMKTIGLDGEKISCDKIGFNLAPRLNAAGRLGQAQLAVELMVTDRKERATELAQYIEGLNNTRKTLERSILLSASRQAKEQFAPEEDAALVLADPEWHPGVIGIVAGRLSEKYHRPVILIAQDKMGAKPGTGSARSVPGFHLFEALNACSEHLVRFGGHAAAAGLGIDDAQIPAFREAFREYAATHLREDQSTPELWIDAEFPFSAFTHKTVGQIESLRPFGCENTKPILCSSGVQLVEPPRTMGKTEQHLSLKLEQFGKRFRAVAFNATDWIDPLSQREGPIDVAFHIGINTFRGRNSIELQLLDWRPSEGNEG